MGKEQTLKQKIEKWFKDWQGELIGEKPAKNELLNIISITKNTKKQGLITTIGELRTLADELEAQIELNKLQVIKDSGMNTKFQLNIINKTGLSDDWKFEKSLKP